MQTVFFQEISNTAKGNFRKKLYTLSRKKRLHFFLKNANVYKIS